MTNGSMTFTLDTTLEQYNPVLIGECPISQWQPLSHLSRRIVSRGLMTVIIITIWTRIISARM